MKSSIACTSVVTLSIGLSLVSAFAVAQNPTPVVDLSSANSTAAKVVTQPNAGVGDSYYQSQVLRDEVRELRGMVEQLSYELQRVKQRQMDDYLDIDRRLSAVMSGVAPTDMGEEVEGQAGTVIIAGQSLQPSQSIPIGAAQVTPLKPASKPLPTTVQTIPQSAPQKFQAPAVNSEEIEANYTQASNLLLKQRDIKGAVLAFKQHVVDYPTSPYIANAHYWLGEIYLLQGQDELARQAFTLVVEQHPSHGKALDATFKLGKIYHQLGELERARGLLETAAKGTGGAANKAQSYLKNNF
mgnify:CR=1 FL=1